MNALDHRFYQGYAYAYPHKTAYRRLDPPVPLRDLWAGEPAGGLFLYLHVPFCEMRCGFCNLFTTPNPEAELAQAYVRTLRRQAERVRAALGDRAVARLAIGGGTPTWLAAGELDALFDAAQEVCGARGIPVSVETSPRTAEPDRLRVLRARGVSRISLGIQSFVEAETAAAGRSQRLEWVCSAIDRVRALGFPVLNLDLMYGLPGQTVASWASSVRRALECLPEELYLYPLYVRPLTGLARRFAPEDELRLACYRAARERLLASGYRQVSMRMFRRRDAPAEDGPVWCCQDDAMIGLGCGARSYTRRLHYACEYAVQAAGVKSILRRWLARGDRDFEVADWGMALDADEQRRRWAIKSVLRTEGISFAGWRARFGSDARAALPEVGELERLGLLEERDGALRPTAAGLERSDAIGPWLYSAPVRARMEACEAE